MAIKSELFAKGDVYIDYPQEDVMFHFDHASGKIFRKFYGSPKESEVSHSSSIFAESRIYGSPISRADYQKGHAKPISSPAAS